MYHLLHSEQVHNATLNHYAQPEPAMYRLANRTLLAFPGPSVPSHLIVGAAAAAGALGQSNNVNNNISRRTADSRLLPRMFVSQAISSDPALGFSPPHSPPPGASALRSVGKGSAAGSRSVNALSVHNAGPVSPGSTGRQYPPYVSQAPISLSKPLPIKHNPVLRTFFPTMSGPSPTAPGPLHSMTVFLPGLAALGPGGRVQATPNGGDVSPMPQPSPAALILLEKQPRSQLSTLAGEDNPSSPSTTASELPGTASSIRSTQKHHRHAVVKTALDSVVKEVQADMKHVPLRNRPVKVSVGLG